MNKRSLPSTLPPSNGLRPRAPEVIMWPFMEAERRGPSAGGIAFNEYDKVREIFVDSLTVNVEAPTEQLAIIRAQEIIERRWYRITTVNLDSSATGGVGGTIAAVQVVGTDFDFDDVQGLKNLGVRS